MRQNLGISLLSLPKTKLISIPLGSISGNKAICTITKSTNKYLLSVCHMPCIILPQFLSLAVLGRKGCSLGRGSLPEGEDVMSYSS